MKRIHLLGTLLFVPPLLAQEPLAGSVEVRSATEVRGASTVLFSTLAGIDPPAFAILSSNLTDAGPASIAGADDFTVPADGWQIGTIRVNGNYSGTSTGPANSVNVYILANSSGLPDSTNLAASSLYAAEGLPYTELDLIDGGDFEITLPAGGVSLPAGTYWLVVQANIEFVSAGQWNWTESSLTPNSGTTNGFESAWFQSQALVASPITGMPECVGAWGGRVSDCALTRNPDTNPPADRDLAFELSGSVLPVELQSFTIE